MLRNWKAADVRLGARDPLGPGVGNGLEWEMSTHTIEKSLVFAQSDGKPLGDFRWGDEKIPWLSEVMGQWEVSRGSCWKHLEKRC